MSVLVLADGAVCVTLPCVDSDGAIRAASRIGEAVRELIEDLTHHEG